MRNLLLLFILFTTIIVTAQTSQFTGEYGKRSETKEGTVIEYTLSLKPDGNFTFHFYRNIDPTQPKENFYGKGTWEADKKSVLFHTNKEADIDEKYTLDFTNTKARFIKKMPRGETATNKKTYFLFYDSEVSWIKGLKLHKK
ncbi:hypothetical protein [Marixanthomonas ophiurae]|uniref:hypothetical protein n=1 Tax=Marixanthomonas ophiurae TaxID=387659 RepID=UPI0011C0795F|nr:hypothetical protein [Marixanthomonas ophiurae]